MLNPKTPATKADIHRIERILRVHDQQFQVLIEYVRNEADETRRHMDTIAEEIMNQHHREFSDHEHRICTLETKA